MSENYVKACSLIVVILFLSSPVISSISNTATTNQQNIIESSETILFTPDPKIEAAIQIINESYLREIITVLYP